MSEIDGCAIQKLNLLAFPRNFTPVCELTGEHATVELITPHITLYYISEVAARQSWQGIVKKIAHLLPPLRSDPPIIGTSEERETRHRHILACKKSLIEFCLAESLSLLSLQKYELAIPGATFALKLCKDIDGELSLSVVEPMLQLAQANLGLQHLKQAEEYLALARWNVLNAESCSDKILTRLHTLLGRVHTSEGNFSGAKDEFAQSIYFSSRTFGAESIQTSVGYYRLGDIFLAQGMKESALAFFDKVVDIWYKYLLSLLSVPFLTVSTSTSISVRPPTEEPLTDEHFADGKFELYQICEVREAFIGADHIATGEAKYTVALFEYMYLGDLAKAARLMESALTIYEASLGASHQSTSQVRAVLDIIKRKRADDEMSMGPDEQSSLTGSLEAFQQAPSLA